MHVFGLTGGIASGKSAVAAIFREHDVPVVDADDVAREVVEPGTPGLAAIVDEFGSGVLDVRGGLDRKLLAARVFGDDDARRRLNRILHPQIGAASAQHFARLGALGAALVCYDAALLVEGGLADAFRPLVVVAAPRAMQHARLVARDGLTPAEADARLDAQAPIEAKVKAADLVIWNDADLATLRARAVDALDDVRRKVVAR